MAKNETKYTYKTLNSEDIGYSYEPSLIIEQAVSAWAVLPFLVLGLYVNVSSMNYN